MKANVITVTPEMAKEFLRGNSSNRQLSKSTVNMYARDMREGKWKLGGQGISISETGRLLDGQHRLNAIIQANVPVTMLVCEGIDDNNVNFDNGKRRSITDQYRIKSDKSDSIISQKGVAFVRMCLMLKTYGELAATMRVGSISFEEFDKFLNDNYNEMVEYYGYMMSGGTVPSGVRNSVVFATMWAITKLDNLFSKDDFVRVANILKTGITMEDYDIPIIAFRDKLLTSNFCGFSGRREVLNRCCYAIKKYIEKQPVNKSFVTKSLSFDFSKLVSK